MNKKIIILSRVSTSPQDIHSQTNDLIREARKLGFDEKHQITIESTESAIKLSEEDRLGIQKMKFHIEQDTDIDSVICWEVSRLARRQKDLYSLRDYLFANKIQLYILNPYVKLLTDDRQQFDTQANIVFSLFATLAENEMMIKKERFLRAKAEMRKRGQKFGGAIIFGYMKNKEKKCVIHPTHGQIIVDLFNHYMNTDCSLYETYLYASGRWSSLFPSKEYKKSQRKIKHFFDTEVYVKGNWCYPPLISQEVWDKVHDKMSKAKCSARYYCKKELLCRGKIYCGHCGRMMTGCGGRTKGYVCSTDKLHSLQINSEVADWIIWEETKTCVNIDSATNNIMERNIKIQELLNSKYAIKRQHINKIVELRKQSSKLTDIYLSGRISESEFNKRIDNINENIRIYNRDIEEIRKEITSYKSIIKETQKENNVVPINVDNVNDFPTRQEFVRKFIKKMIVKRDEERPHTICISFEFAVPVKTVRSDYLYIYKNQANSQVFRINEDGTEDLVYNNDKRAKRNKKTGRFEKTED